MKNKNLSYKVLLPLGFVIYLISIYVGEESFIGAGIGTISTIMILFGWFDLFGKSKYVSLLPYIFLLIALFVVCTIFEVTLLNYIAGSLLFALVFWFISLPIKKFIQKKKS